MVVVERPFAPEARRPQSIELFIPEHFGPCAGVDRAIDGLHEVCDIVEEVGKRFPGQEVPIYCIHEIVHNHLVVEEFRERGVIFVEDYREVPDNAIAFLSAHGHEPHKKPELEARGCFVIDGTCQLVQLVQNAAIRYAVKNDYTVVYFGKQNHQEMKGVRARVPENQWVLISSDKDIENFDPENLRDKKCIALLQTTPLISKTLAQVDAFRKKVPHLESPSKDTYCYATQENQEGAAALVEEGVTIAIVIGDDGRRTGRESSNSQELKNAFLERGVEAHLVLTPEDVDINWFKGHSRVGATAGASAPQYILEQFIAWFRREFNVVSEKRLGDGQGSRHKFVPPTELARLKEWLENRVRIATL